jgi:hypothetical protein
VSAMPESPPHVALKNLLVGKLREWYGASINEYPSSGHELDVFGVTSSGVSIYIEVIWSPSKMQFFRDMSMLQQSDADVKLVVVNPEIMANGEMVREFGKAVVAQRRQGKVICGDLLNGQRIAEDPEYVDYALRNLIEQLVNEAQTRSGESEKPLGNPKCPICETVMRGAEVERYALSSGIYDRKEPERRRGWKCDNCGMDFTENEL